jgi:Bromodomain
VAALINHEHGEPFASPVTDEVAPGYSDVVKKPMDLSKILAQVRAGGYSNAASFAADVRLVFSNCLLYNPPGNWVSA